MIQENDNNSPPEASQQDVKNENNEFLPGFTTMDDFKKEAYKTLTEAIRHSNALPSNHDWNFYNTFETFPKIMTIEGDNILNLMNTIIRNNDIDCNIKNRILDDKNELVIETNDMILEKVASNIDEMNGIKKTAQQAVELQTVCAQLPINGSWNRVNNPKFTVNPLINQEQSTDNCIKLITGKNIVRPQTFFKDKIDNSLQFPWQPRITEKPNSLKPLALYLEEYENRQEFCHPYELELERFTPTAEQLLEESADFPKPIQETELIEITQPDQLDELVETLRNCKQFAVDLEHHSYRSFMGITCLLQISTEHNDYLIDTLQLRDRLSILNEVFTKPTIVKIFHGADCDIEWLQRDLSIYVVNMFDTHQAAKVLEYSGLSLAYLMKRFCNILPNKKFQLADWRIRPLPDELKNYAREDTHYLIYIYKKLKMELLSKANNTDKLLKVVLDRSTEICKKRYFKPILTDDSHLDLYRRSKKLFDNRQLYALKEMYAWRDHTAREEDESLPYVLPNHMLLQISEILPREMQGILACCNPIPPLVRSNLLELHKIILKAREQPLVKPILKENSLSRGVPKLMSKINMDSPLHCPHDLNRNHEISDNLPTLLNNQSLRTKYEDTVKLKLEIEQSLSNYSIFNENNDIEDKVMKERFKQVRGLSFLSPYQRYLLVRPFVQAEEDKVEAARKEEEAKKQQQENQQKELNQNNDNRTDEDRINSVREHYVKLAKQFAEDTKKKQENEQSLLQMGGSKKRKREPDSDENYCREIVIVDDNLQPMPTFKMPSPKKSRRKRKFDNHNDNDEPSPSKKQMRNNHNNKNKRKQANKQGGGHQNRQHHEQNTGRRPQQQHHQQQQQQQQRGNKRMQETANFTPYDYAGVDFRQFQGGAGSVNTGVNIRHQHKAKGKRRMGNKNTKSSIFTNTNNNKNNNRGRRR